MAVLLALLSSVLWGMSDFWGGTASRRLPVSSVLGVSQLAALLALTPIAVVVGSDGTSYVLPGVLAGVVGLAALSAFYRALAIGTMGVVAPVGALGVALPVAVGVAGGDHPTSLQVAGIAVAVAGVILASGPELSGRAGLAPLALALAAAAGFGLVIVLVTKGSQGGGPGRVVLFLLVMRLSSIVLLSMLWAVTGRRPVEVKRPDLRLLALIGLGDVGANAAYAVASRASLLSVVSVLGSLYPVVTVLLARQLHDERLRTVQVGGVAATVVGIALLAVG